MFENEFDPNTIPILPKAGDKYEEVRTRTCQSCTHLVGTRDYFTKMENWFCDKTELGTNVVTGQRVRLTCVETRTKEPLCGMEGKWWELYVRPAKQEAANVKEEQPAFKQQTMKPDALKSLVKKKTISLDDL